MTVLRQLFEVVVAGIIAGIATFAVAAVANSQTAVTIGVVLACMYYFSRYPWGSQRGAEYNERIDELYDEYLPF